jgi:hypothetical protein
VRRRCRDSFNGLQRAEEETVVDGRLKRISHQSECKCPTPALELHGTASSSYCVHSNSPATSLFTLCRTTL